MSTDAPGVIFQTRRRRDRGGSPSCCARSRHPFDRRRVSPNERIRIALVGVGIRGQQDLRSALRTPGVELAAAADVYDGRLTLAKERVGQPACSRRATTARCWRGRDVDAVIIATPDHWHAQMAVDAMKAGKDVYVEKPMVQAARRRAADRSTRRVRPDASCRSAASTPAPSSTRRRRELFRAGAIGELNLVEAWINRNSSMGAWQYSIPPDASPQTIDWDRFLGRAPKRPFDPVRLFRWRNYRDYGTGIPGDLFVHLFTGIHFVLDALGPTRAIASGGLRHWNDGRDVPDVMLALYDYPKTAIASGVHLVAEGELRRRRRRRARVPLRRARRRAHDWRQRR